MIFAIFRRHLLLTYEILAFSGLPTVPRSHVRSVSRSKRGLSANRCWFCCVGEIWKASDSSSLLLHRFSFPF